MQIKHFSQGIANSKLSVNSSYSNCYVPTAGATETKAETMHFWNLIVSYSIVSNEYFFYEYFFKKASH